MSHEQTWVDFKKPPLEKSLPYHSPHLVLEWDEDGNGGLTPDFFRYGSSFKASWKCKKCHHTFVAPIKNRTREKGSNCPRCRYADHEYNLAKLYPSLLEEWDYDKNNEEKLYPEEITPKTTRKVWWKCSSCQSSWQAQVSNRVNSKKLGCAACARKKIRVTESYNLLAVYPEIAKEWDQDKNIFTPDQVNPKSTEKAHWICGTCTHQWQASVYFRTQRNPKCPMCSGKALTKETSFGGKYPELLRYWDYSKNGDINPHDISHGSHKIVFWKCDKREEHKWETSIRSVAKGGRCPHCSSRSKEVLHEDSFEAHCPSGAALWDHEKNHGKLPSQFTPQSNHKAWFKCEEHGSWEAKIQRITLGNRCKWCYKERGSMRRSLIKDIYMNRNK